MAAWASHGVKTYGEVLREYEFHLGAKSADAKGKPSGKQTVGLLHRGHVRVERIIYIDRESNRLEEIEAGVAHENLWQLTQQTKCYRGSTEKHRISSHRVSRAEHYTLTSTSGMIEGRCLIHPNG